MSPLHIQLRKGTKWIWTQNQQIALLVHFDSAKPLLVYVDASSYGVGAVLAHKMPDISEKPTAFVSCTLTPAERNYSQLEKEALAIVYAVKHFHQYLYGTDFTLYSDHKSLERLLGEFQQIPPLALARIQRWALTLAAYQYTIKYKPGKSMSTADALSRLPLQTTLNDSQVLLPGDLCHLLNHLDQAIVTASQIKVWTDKDPLLCLVSEN